MPYSTVQYSTVQYSTVQYSVFIKSPASGSSDLIYKCEEQKEKTSLQI